MGLNRYRKKPVVIEAIEVRHENRAEIEALGENVTTHETPAEDFEFYVEIETLEGTMRGDYWDYIIKGVSGELYPCKPDIFAATYEPAA